MIQMALTLILDQLPIGNLTLPGIGLTLGPTPGLTTIRGGEKILTSHLHQGGIRKICWHQDVVSLLSSLIIVDIIFCIATNVLWLLVIVS